MRREKPSMRIISPSMKEAVEMIREYLKGIGEEITDEELSQKINLTSEQLREYITNETDMPAYLPNSLLEAYKLQVVQLTDVVRIDRPRLIPLLDNGK